MKTTPTLSRLALMASLLIGSLPNASAYDFEQRGIHYNIKSDTEVEVEGDDESITNLNIPATVTIWDNQIGDDHEYAVTSIKGEAFKGRKFYTISIPSSVKTIGVYAFSDCYDLQSITIADGVTLIASCAFANIKPSNGYQLVLDIPSTVDVLGWYAFASDGISAICYHRDEPLARESDLCPATQYSQISLYVPKGSVDKYQGTDYWKKFQRIVSLEDHYNELAFNYATTAASTLFVTINGTHSQFPLPADLSLPETIRLNGKERMVTSVSSSLFKGNATITSVTIPATYKTCSSFESCTALTEATLSGAMETFTNSMFYKCTKLQKVTLTKGTKIIGSFAFGNCKKLSAITLPSTVTEVRNGAFAQSGLTDITLWADTPPEVDNQAFTGVWSKATLHVPHGTQPLYAAHEVWSKFGTIVEMDADATEPADDTPGIDNLKPLTTGVSIDLADLSWSQDGNDRELLHRNVWFNMLDGSGDSFDDNEGVLKLRSAIANGEDAATRVAIAQSGHGQYYMSRLLGGIVFRVPQGKGTVILDCVCPGGSFEAIETSVCVYVGGDPIVNTGTTSSAAIERHEVEVPIEVGDANGACIYIFAENKYHKAGTGVDIYGVAWCPHTDEGDEPVLDIEPMSQTMTDNYARDPLFADANLSNTVINNVYYCLDGSENSGLTDRRTVGIGREMTAAEMNRIAAQTTDISQLKEMGYSGLVLQVPSGGSTITVETITWGDAALEVKVGTAAARSLVSENTISWNMFTINCNVKEPTLVYLYSVDRLSLSTSESPESHRPLAKRPQMSANDSWVELASLKWQAADAADISTTIRSDHASAVRFYDPRGIITNRPLPGLTIVRLPDGRVKKIITR